MADRMIEGWTLTEAQEMLADFKAALKAIAGGKSYAVDGVTVTKADEHFIDRKIKYFAKIINRHQSGRRGGPRFFRAVPRDR